MKLRPWSIRQWSKSLSCTVAAITVAAVTVAAVTVAAITAVVVPASASIPDTPDGALASPRVTLTGGVGGPVADVAVSGSGRYVVFDSPADDFYTGEPNDPAGTTCEVFRRDLLTDTTILVSQSASGTVGGGCSSHPAVDYDGNVIAFLTTATALDSDGTHAIAVVRNISANTLSTASVANGASGAAATDGVGAVAISGDGNTVAFTSSQNLASGVSTGGVTQVWARNLSAQTTTLVSNATGSTIAPATASAGAPSVSEYGTEVAFSTSAALTSTGTGATPQVYVRNLTSATTTLASVANGGAVANAPATAPALSARGNAVAFLTTATNLGDPSGQADDYVRSLSGATTTLVNTAADGTTVSDAPAGAPSLSASGDVVAFASAADNLGANSEGHVQIWVHDLTRGLVTLASPASGAATGADGDSTAPSLAEGGITVAYTSTATNLDPADSDTVADAYVRRVRVAQALAPNSTTLITRDGLDGRSSQDQPSGLTGTATQFAVSGNGQYVVFEIDFTPLTGETGGSGESDEGVYVRDLQTGDVELVNRLTDTKGYPGAILGGCIGYDAGVAISDDGRYVAFAANAGDGTGCQVYLRDRQSGTTTLESVSSAGVTANATSFNPSLSGNGDYLLFTSAASNLTANHPAVGDAPYYDVYERDLQTGTTTIVSLPDTAAPGGTQFATLGISGYGTPSSVSDDGRYVVFESRDARLEPGSPYGSGETAMTYLRDMQNDRTYALPHDGSSWGDADTTSDAAVISADGSTIAFDATSTNLVPGHSSSTEDVYYRAVQFDAGGDLASPIHIASVPTGPEPGATGTFGNALAQDPAISSTGQVITFLSEATNYGPATVDGEDQVWQRDTQAATTTLISRQSGASGAPANGYSAFPPAASADGSVIAFETASPNLAPDGSAGQLGYVRVLTAAPTPGSPTAPPPSTTPPPATMTTPPAPLAPVNTAPPTLLFSSTPVTNGVVVTCNPATWLNDPTTITTTWIRNGVTISGATGPHYLITNADIHAQIQCEQQATNAAGTAVADSASSGLVKQAPPTVTSAPTPALDTTTPAAYATLIDQDLTEGGIAPSYAGGEYPYVDADDLGGFLICDPAGFSYSAGTTVAFTWFNGGTAVGPGALAGPAGPGQIWVVEDQDRGNAFSCQETVTNADGLTSTATSGTLTVPDEVYGCEVGPPQLYGSQKDIPGPVQSDGNHDIQDGDNPGGGVIENESPPPVNPCDNYVPTAPPATPAPPIATVGVPLGYLVLEVDCPAIAGCGGTDELVSGTLDTKRLVGIALARSPRLARASREHATKPVVLARASYQLKYGQKRTLKLKLSSAELRTVRRTGAAAATLVVLPAGAKPRVMAVLTLTPRLPPTISHTTLTGIARQHTSVSFTLHAGRDGAPKLSSVTISLPHGLAFITARLAQAVTVRGQRFTTALHHGVLKVTFRAPLAAASVSIAPAAIATSPALARQAAQHQLSVARVTVAATDTAGRSTPLEYVVERPH